MSKRQVSVPAKTNSKNFGGRKSSFERRRCLDMEKAETMCSVCAVPKRLGKTEVERRKVRVNEKWIVIEGHKSPICVVN